MAFAAIVYSHRLNPDASFTEPMKKRVDNSVQLYQDGFVSKLIMTGGLAQPEAEITHAAAMKIYATQNGIPELDVLTEELSLDTVLQVFRSKLVADKNGLNKLLMVSGVDQLHRIALIANKFLGEKYEVNFHGVVSERTTLESYESEIRSADVFLNTYRDISPGDDLAIARRTIESHGMYMGKFTLEQIMTV